MRILFTACILLIACPLFSQMRTVSGRLTSGDDGTPLPGVNVTIKGTQTGTATDADGWYTINVPIGATLVYSFIGLATREIVVTATNLQPARPLRGKNKTTDRAAKEKPLPESLYKDNTAAKGPGIAVLSEKSSVYKNAASIDPSSVRAIRRRANTVVVKSNRDPLKRTGFGLQFSSSLTLERVTQLPSLQRQFAQGRSSDGGAMWRGPDDFEIFSWGPLIRTLEFDGTDYLFDKNGRLVMSGSGNGKQARVYDPLNFFRTGYTAVNEVMLSLPTPRSGTFNIDIENRNKSGVIPNSTYQRSNVSASLRNFDLSKSIELNSSLSYNHSTGNLLNRGANLTSVVGGLYRTPATFDNANGLSIRTARYSPDAYTTSLGSIRSHAPGFADNPFGLVNTLPDEEKQDRIVGTLNIKYSKKMFSTVINGTFDQQRGINIFGIPVGYAGYLPGRITERKDNQQFGSVTVTPSLDLNEREIDLKFYVSYQMQYTKRSLERWDGFDFESGDISDMDEAAVVVRQSGKQDRTSHEVSVNAAYIHNQWLTVRLSNRSYFSNTISEKTYTNLFPTAGLNIDFSELFDLYSFNYLKLFSTISRTIREAPLLYSNWSYASSRLQANDYASFYENTELFFNPLLTPETERKFEMGVRTSFANSRFEVEALCYNNYTMDFIAPLWNGGFSLQNAADIKNYGGSVSASYRSQWRDTHWGMEVRWSTYKSTVQSVHGDQDIVALSGFQTIQSVLVAGKPVGAIYGSTFVKNADGQLVIGQDGFPIKNSTLTMIGNPIPDWNISIAPYLQARRFKFSLLIDIRRGGDVWNGTQAALDYTGTSKRSGELRNTSNYVFEGVDLNGVPNTMPVSFSDLARSIEENRWVRYGWDGVGRENIEDASWFRLSEASVSYTVRSPFNSRVIKDIRISLIGRNLFLITPYTGVDPSSALFGNATSSGLDLFNMPSTRSLSAQLTIKI